MTKSKASTLAHLITVFCCGLLISSCSKTDYTDTQSNSGQFSDHLGKWMVINYWAVWCKPCIAEIPELNHFAKINKDKAVVFAVDFDQSSGDKLQAGIEKLNIEFAVLTNDPAQILGYKRPHVLPTTLIFNPEGQLHKTLIGPQTEKSLLQSMSLP